MKPGSSVNLYRQDARQLAPHLENGLQAVQQHWLALPSTKATYALVIQNHFGSFLEDYGLFHEASSVAKLALQFAKARLDDQDYLIVRTMHTYAGYLLSQGKTGDGIDVLLQAV